MITKNLKNRKTILCKPQLEAYEERVKSGLAITPAEMMDRQEKGIPISSQQLPEDMFEDGDHQLDDQLPIDSVRGIDVVDVWNLSKDSKQKTSHIDLSQIKID